MDILNQLIEALSKKQLLDKIDSIILFGSRARGDHQDRSDYDLAFTGNKITSSDWIAIVDSCEDLPTLLDIQPVLFQNIPKALQENILKEGKIIYGK